MPFGDDVLVFRVGGKIFLLAMLSSVPFQFNVKCDPERAIEWRERSASIRPGYHMNKKHWNTVIVDGDVPSADIFRMIDDSFALVAAPTPSRRSAGRHRTPAARRKKRKQQ